MFLPDHHAEQRYRDYLHTLEQPELIGWEGEGREHFLELCERARLIWCAVKGKH